MDLKSYGSFVLYDLGYFEIQYRTMSNLFDELYLVIFNFLVWTNYFLGISLVLHAGNSILRVPSKS